jgi:hypothetical protein
MDMAAAGVAIKIWLAALMDTVFWDSMIISCSASSMSFLWLDSLTPSLSSKLATRLFLPAVI